MQNFKDSSRGNRDVSIDYLRCIAALLILNSHYKTFYPDRLSFMSFGGLIGNCLFVLLSGYCLYYIGKNFFCWYKKRIIRIYLPYLTISLPSFMADSDYSLNSFSELIFPIQKYHFIASILVLYLLFYLIQTIHFNLHIRYSILFTIIFIFQFISYFIIIDYKEYNLSDHFNIFEMTSYINIMLIGAFIRENKEKIKIINIKKLQIITIVAFILIICFTKCLSFIGDKLVIWILTMLFISVFSSLLINKENDLKKSHIVSFFASITLELYLSQMFIIRKCIDNLAFPEGLVLGTVMIVGSAVMIKKITDYIVYKLNKLR